MSRASIAALVLGAALFGALYAAVLPRLGTKIDLAAARSVISKQWILPALAIHFAWVFTGLIYPFVRGTGSSRSGRLPWADLLRRVFADDVLQCPCGGCRSVIAVVADPAMPARCSSRSASRTTWRHSRPRVLRLRPSSTGTTFRSPDRRRFGPVRALGRTISAGLHFAAALQAIVIVDAGGATRQGLLNVLDAPASSDVGGAPARGA